MLNRGAVILKYREPAIRWINEADPNDAGDEITATDPVQDRTVYLISEGDADGEGAIEAWIGVNFEMLFEMELNGWYTAESLWPEERTLSLFSEWFEVEYHSVIVDTVAEALLDDEE
jgi:hypothetical protein